MQYLPKVDPEISGLIELECERQADVIRMIASENYASAAVMEATGSCLANKYSEGYALKRYYQGQEFVDKIELIAIERMRKLFKVEHVNVQPYSGSPANQAVYMALLKPGDRVLGMDLAAGGHLTHGAKVSFSGKQYEIQQYGVTRETGMIDYEQVRAKAKEFQPKMIIAGASAYPRKLDFAAFRSIADEVGAVLMADISHFSGLCLSGDHPSPVPHAQVITTTTHKLFRGPRGAVIMCDKEFASAIDKAVFPGLQGGPHNNTTAAIAVAAKEADSSAYVEYCHQVVKNAKVLAQALLDNGFALFTGGTDNHLVLMDVTPMGITGNPLAIAMEKAGIVANSNKIPFDTRPANDPSGVRLGTAAITSRGMREPEVAKIADFITMAAKNAGNESELGKIKRQIKDLCANFPAPGLVL